MQARALPVKEKAVLARLLIEELGVYIVTDRMLSQPSLQDYSILNCGLIADGVFRS
jgi:hypothetical protein